MGVHLSEQKQADYKDYLQRFQEDPQSISAEEAAQHYQELMQHAPPELANEANQHILSLLPQNERDVLATNIFDEECYATPALADGRIYLRTSTSLYCFSQ